MDSTIIAFEPLARPDGGDLVLLVHDDLVVPASVSDLVPGLASLVERATAAERFKGKAASGITIAAPAGLDDIDRLHIVGIGASSSAVKGGTSGKADDEPDWRMMGGFVAGRVAGRTATILADLSGVAEPAEALAELALGARLRLYSFDRYKTKKKDDADGGATRITIRTANPEAAALADTSRESLAAGVNLCRDLVNEPPNVLYPLEFARRVEALSEGGLTVEILSEDRIREIGMRALVAVGDGSVHDSCVALMTWNGGPPGEAPLAFIGKGVCFDSGGISIKPAGGMEDMKGDMAGAAAVVGLMHALAARKAPINVIGAIGLTENMPDGKAQRPGDIVTTLSGQTVEMVNSDAEGRLVLGDVLWYVQDRFKPRLMVDLATLTGAVIVALGQDHAGLFANDDDLADRLLAAGRATGEKVWRMPLAPAYDKLIDSKVADMKNTGGRQGGSITAAHFIGRYVQSVDGKPTPWAHLDIAGTGMGAPKSEINTSWSSGWGVRLLDALVRGYEP